MKSSDNKVYTYTASKVKTDMPKKYRIDVKPVKDKIVQKKRGGTIKEVEENGTLPEIRGKSYILITDIGRDIDDTLALITLLYYHQNLLLSLKAIVVSGSNLEKRAKCVYYWLNKFGVIDIPVIHNPCYDYKLINDVNNNECVLPYDQTQEETIKQYKEAFPDVNKYPSLFSFFEDEQIDKINVLSIGPVTPLYDAIKSNEKFMKKIEEVYFQGNTFIEGIVNSKGGEISNRIIADTRPLIGAYNFGFGSLKEVIKEETQYVIDTCMKYNKKLYFVGKNTVYLIKFTLDDLKEIDQQLALTASQKTIKFARNLTGVFKTVFAKDIKNYDILDDLINNSNLESEDINEKVNVAFYRNLEKLSNPYDLILVYLALFPEKFDVQKSRFYDKTTDTKDVMLSNGKTMKETTFPGNVDMPKDYIHFNDEDSAIFYDNVDDVKAHLLKILKTAFDFMSKQKSSLEYSSTSAESSESPADLTEIQDNYDTGVGGSRKRRPSTNKKPSKKPVTKPPKKASSKKSPKRS
jgi:hypothetical protein